MAMGAGRSAGLEKCMSGRPNRRHQAGSSGGGGGGKGGGDGGGDAGS